MKGRWTGRFSNLIGSWDDEHGHWDKKWPVSAILAFIPVWNLGGPELDADLSAALFDTSVSRCHMYDIDILK